MSRTYRRHNPKMNLGTLENRRYKSGKVRDGTPQHYSSGCDNHGSCDWCRNRRTFATKRQEPIVL